MIIPARKGYTQTAGDQSMTVYAPDYYPFFRCIAGECGHTCCQGWEIDIDPASLNRFRRLEGPFGEKLRACIAEEPEPHFILQADERCPLLTDDNLCSLILREGEDALCQICRDHPRFRNYWSDRIEMGLGMACEAAGRLILSSGHPLSLVPVCDDPEEEAQTPSDAEIQLMAYRDKLLAEVRETGPAARLKEYLIFRHLADALYDGRTEERECFINAAFEWIMSGWDGHTPENLIERARAFSNEFEYDDEGMEKLLKERERQAGPSRAAGQ